MATRIHLDTDFGGDPDDARALAMLLGWPGVELVGVTRTLDVGGRRAGYVAYCLELVGREGIPVVAGAGVSLTTLAGADLVIADERHWPRGIVPPTVAAGDGARPAEPKYRGRRDGRRHRPADEPGRVGGVAAGDACPGAGGGDGRMDGTAGGRPPRLGCGDGLQRPVGHPRGRDRRR